eukprot:2250183-Pyramimonas_sp.AAC.1
MEDQAEAKRQRSNMSYWLSANAKKEEYDNSPIDVRRQFFHSFVADSIAKKGDMTTGREIKTGKIIEKTFEWVGKERMITLIGEKKAQSKIDSGKLEHRPDRDTGADGEWDREYKLYTDQGSSHESDFSNMKLDNTESLEGEAAVKDAQEKLTSAAMHMAGNGTNTILKREDMGPSDGGSVGLDGAFSETANTLMKDPRK